MKNIVSYKRMIHSRWKALSMCDRGLHKGIPTTIKPSAAPQRSQSQLQEFLSKGRIRSAEKRKLLET